MYMPRLRHRSHLYEVLEVVEELGVSFYTASTALGSRHLPYVTTHICAPKRSRSNICSTDGGK